MLASLVLGGLALPAIPGRAALQEDAFESRLEEVRHLGRKHEWQEAREGLVALFEQHEGEDYALKHLFELRDLLERYDFQRIPKTLEPEELVGGELLSYKASTGRVKLRYEAGDSCWAVGRKENLPADFVKRNRGEARHPAYFVKNLTLEIRGDRFDSRDLENRPSYVVIGEGEHGAHRVYLGNDRYLASIERKEGFYENHFVSAKQSVLKKNQPYHVKIVVAPKKITLFCNGKKLLTTRVETPTEGRFTLGRFQNIKEIKISGTAAASWMQGLQDEAVRKSWETWQEDYDVDKEIPGWIAEHIMQEGSPWTFQLPGPASRENEERWGEIQQYFAKGEFSAAVSEVEKILDGEVSEAFRSYCLAQAYARVGRFQEALQHCERVLDLHRAYAPARILRASLLSHEGDREAAIAELEVVLDASPAPGEAYERLARLHLLEGDSKSAEEVVFQGILDCAPIDRLTEAGAVLIRSRNGPDWVKTFEHKTANFVVRSDINKATCVEAARILESSLKLYSKVLMGKRSRPSVKEPAPVYLFSGKGSYHAFAEALLGDRMEYSNGLYSPLLKTLLVVNQPDRDDMLEVVRHEAFHQYLDTFLPNPPIWFNEGMAEYFETSDSSDAFRKTGAIVKKNLEVLLDANVHWTPFDELIRMPSEAFMSQAGKHYPQSWALIHYLREGGKGPRRTFDAYFDGLLAGESMERAARHLLDVFGAEGLRRAVREHLVELQRDGGS